MPTETVFSAQKFWKNLHAWYRRSARDLPWRRDSSPYKIWISEIMLQQTTVSAVVPYFERWLKKFPNVTRLARADQGEVLRLWQGLGYYARARNLHKAARFIVEQHGGEFPSSLEAIEALPGIGRYTARAIASAAFGRRLPAVDTNLARVIARVYRIQDSLKDPETRERIWDLAHGLAEASDARHFNSAMMDLGATLCVPRDPSCLICPVSEFCEARRLGEERVIPLSEPKRVFQKIDVSCAVIWNKGRVYIQRRPEKGLMGGLWEFPGGKRERGESPEECVMREVKEETGFSLKKITPLTVIRHGYTTFKVTLRVFSARTGHVKSRCREPWKWVGVERLKEFAFPSANVKIIRILEKKFVR